MKPIFLSLVTLMFFGCDVGKGLTDLGNSAEKVGKNLESVSKNLAIGLDGVGDIGGWRSSYQDNSKLREAVEILRQRLAAISTGSTEVLLSERSLRFKVDSYQGEFKINLYIDKKENSVWVGKEFRDLTLQRLNIDYNDILAKNFRVVDLAVAPLFINNLTPILTPIPPSNEYVKYTDRGTLFPSPWNFNLENFNFTPIGNRIVTSMTEKVDEAFQNYLNLGLTFPGDPFKIADLNQKLNSIGEHVIIVELLPEKVNQQGILSLTGRFFTESSNGRIEEIGSFTFSNQGRIFEESSYNIRIEEGKVSQHRFFVKVK